MFNNDLSDLITVEIFTSSSQSIYPNDYGVFEITVSKQGYRFIGIVGVSTSGTGAYGVLQDWVKVNDNRAKVYIINRYTTEMTATVYINALLIKNL